MGHWQVCCKAIDDKAQQAAQLCRELVSAPQPSAAVGAATAADQGAREDTSQMGPGAGDLGGGAGGARGALQTPVTPVGAKFLDGRGSQGVGGLEGGGKISMSSMAGGRGGDRLAPRDPSGFATSAKRVGEGLQRLRPSKVSPSELPGDDEAMGGGVYSSISAISDLIHVSMTVWVGAAILLLAATLLLVKRCASLRPQCPNAPATHSSARLPCANCGACACKAPGRHAAEVEVQAEAQAQPVVEGGRALPCVALE